MKPYKNTLRVIRENYQRLQLSGYKLPPLEHIERLVPMMMRYLCIDCLHPFTPESFVLFVQPDSLDAFVRWCSNPHQKSHAQIEREQESKDWIKARKARKRRYVLKNGYRAPRAQKQHTPRATFVRGGLPSLGKR